MHFKLILSTINQRTKSSYKYRTKYKRPKFYDSPQRKGVSSYKTYTQINFLLKFLLFMFLIIYVLDYYLF